jgi:hypothetical protein
MWDPLQKPNGGHSAGQTPTTLKTKLKPQTQNPKPQTLNPKSQTECAYGPDFLIFGELPRQRVMSVKDSRLQAQWARTAMTVRGEALHTSLASKKGSTQKVQGFHLG